MRDLTIELQNRPGALAEMGEVLGDAGVSIEGGGGCVVDGKAIMHFLFADGVKARSALEAAGIQVVQDREVVAQKLDQDVPGQLGSVARAMAQEGINIEVVYSDHDHQLILGVDKVADARNASACWTQAAEGAKRVREHVYTPTIRWVGNTGSGTSAYGAYSRDHLIQSAGKPTLEGSADPSFTGSPGRWNPEELLVASLSACHQLWYLHLCAEAGVIVTGYEDRPAGVMAENRDGSGRFTRVVLRPQVRITTASDSAVAKFLHLKAHDLCFIARSVRFPVECESTIETAD